MVNQLNEGKIKFVGYFVLFFLKSQPETCSHVIVVDLKYMEHTNGKKWSWMFSNSSIHATRILVFIMQRFV